MGSVPPKSEVFHKYSLALHSVILEREKHAINLHFRIEGDIATKKLGKRDESVYLLNEIYERTMKTYIELLYCMRYMAPVIRLDIVNVTIQVFLNAANLRPFDEIQYTLEERGYPDLNTKDIRKVCRPDLKWTGAKLKDELLRQRTS